MLVGKHQDGLCAERGTLETVLHMSAMQQINGDFRASFRILHTTGLMTETVRDIVLFLF